MSSTHFKNSRAEFTHYPLLWLALAFSGGIFFGKNLDLEWFFFLPLICVGSSFGLFLRKNNFSAIFILIAFFATGGFYIQLSKENNSPNKLGTLFETNIIKSGDPVELEGLITDLPETSVGGVYLFLEADQVIYKEKRIKTSGQIRLWLPIFDPQTQEDYQLLNLQTGAGIRVATNLKREERYLNPGGVSFIRILDQQGIEATATLKSILMIERLENREDLYSLTPIYQYRQHLIDTFKAKLNPETSGIVIASMLGNRNYLTKETADTFRAGGTFHVLVISGLHITIIGGILLLIVSFFTSQRAFQFIITSIILWGYAFAVGAQIPVVRAALMLTILLFSNVIYRKGTLLNALGGCALVILIWRPEDLFNPSFHLTFLSLFGIISFVFPLIEKLRAIGVWMPSKETPFPPNAPGHLRSFCEMLYWNEKIWAKKLAENVWDCRIFKSNYGTKLNEYRLQKIVRFIFEGIMVTTIVQLFLLPLLVLYFHRLAFSSIILNLWVGPLIILQNLSAILLVIVSQMSNFLSVPFVELTEFFNLILLSFPQFVVENNFASGRVPVYSGEMKIIYPLYFLPVIILTFFINKWDPFKFAGEVEEKRKSRGRRLLFSKKILLPFALIVYFVLFFLMIFHPYSSSSPDGKLKVDFLDVGQGDAAFVTFPNGETMLIDGGGNLNFNNLQIEKEDGSKVDFEPDWQGVGELVVSEFLWEKGYSKIDYIVSTHEDADHLNGLIRVARNFDIKAAIIGQKSESDNFLELENILTRKNVPIAQIKKGESLEIGGVNLEILNPLPKNDKNTSTNNNSIVLRLTYGFRKFLLTGDIEKETERDLLKTPELLRSDIVKVAHHGSRTSSGREFVVATKAQYAIISVGRKSRFGHPHTEVVSRWKNSGAKVYTTGERGTVTVSTDGKNLEIQTFEQ